MINVIFLNECDETGIYCLCVCNITHANKTNGANVKNIKVQIRVFTKKMILLEMFFFIPRNPCKK